MKFGQHFDKFCKFVCRGVSRVHYCTYWVVRFAKIFEFSYGVPVSIQIYLYLISSLIMVLCR
jgi:hypothetical protein